MTLCPPVVREVAEKISMMPNAASPRFSIVLDGVVRENVVTVRLLALCPMLAVSVSLRAAALLGVLTLCVMALSGFLVAVLRPLTARFHSLAGVHGDCRHRSRFGGFFAGGLFGWRGTGNWGFFCR